MKFTNRLNLPQPIVDAVANDPYSKGEADYSITGLISPPRITQLKEKFDDQITEDVSERIWSLLGQIGHGILERAEKEAWAEPRYFVDLDGKRISGQLDRFHKVNEHIQDYKITSLYKVKKGLPSEWEEQVNGYALLARLNDFRVKTADVVAILRDWRKREVRRVLGYPIVPVAVLPVPMWTDDKVHEFLKNRIGLHEAAKTNLPECTDEERWNDGDKYAVIKGASTRAVRVYQSRVEADEHCEKFGSDYRVQVRHGENIRCEDFCLVAPFCEQWKKINDTRAKASEGA